MIIVELPMGIHATVEHGKWQCSDGHMLHLLETMPLISTGYFLNEDDKLAQTAVEVLDAKRLPSPGLSVPMRDELPEGAVY